MIKNSFVSPKKLSVFFFKTWCLIAKCYRMIFCEFIHSKSQEFTVAEKYQTFISFISKITVCTDEQNRSYGFTKCWRCFKIKKLSFVWHLIQNFQNIFWLKEIRSYDFEGKLNPRRNKKIKFYFKNRSSYWTFQEKVHRPSNRFVVA